MAIEIHLPRKYSRETLEMLRNNDGPNVVMTPGAVETTIEHTTNKLGEPVTKQSVLDIFNKQVIERVNSLPKYSRDYYFVPMGNFGGWHDNGLHAGLVNMLGNAYLSNEYGFMCMHDYLKLSDFRDREGDITIDDLSNTFSETINKLGTLSRLKILIKKGNRTLTQNTYYAISNGSTPPNLIDYNEVKNRIISSDEFNSVCKKWYRRIIENSNDNIMVYEYRLPDPVVNDINYYASERHSGRPGEDSHETYGTNRVQIRTFFATGVKSLYFKLPKVTRSLKGFSIALDRNGGNHRHSLIFDEITLVNFSTDVIVAYSPARNLGGNNGNHTFMFDNPTVLSNNAYDDLYIKITLHTDGDWGDASWINFTITELIWGDDSWGDPTGGAPIVPLRTINSETTLSEGDSSVKLVNENRRVRKGKDNWEDEPYTYSKKTVFVYKYLVKGFTRKIHSVHYSLVNNPVNIHPDRTQVVIKRNGRIIGSSGYQDKGNTYDWKYKPIYRCHIGNIDIKNGDEILFTFESFSHGGGVNNSYNNFFPSIEYIKEQNIGISIKHLFLSSEPISK